jgi:hypothetical protein
MTNRSEWQDNSPLPNGLERLLSDGRDALASELSMKLDVEAGLAAIVGTDASADTAPSVIVGLEAAADVVELPLATVTGTSRHRATPRT